MTRTYHYADCDCHYFEVCLEDEAFAHRLERTHIEQTQCTEANLDRKVIEQ